MSRINTARRIVGEVSDGVASVAEGFRTGSTDSDEIRDSGLARIVNVKIPKEITTATATAPVVTVSRPDPPAR